MQWNDSFYPELERIANKQAFTLSRKTNRQQFFYDELYSEAIFQIPFIFKRWKPEKGSLKKFYTTSICGALKNLLRDNRIVKVKRKHVDVYNGFYSTKKKQPLLSDETILAKYGVTTAEFEEIKLLINNPTTVLDEYTQYVIPDFELTKSKEIVKTLLKPYEIDALVDFLVHKKSLKQVADEYNISKTMIRLLINKVKTNCKMYMNNDY